MGLGLRGVISVMELASALTVEALEEKDDCCAYPILRRGIG